MMRFSKSIILSFLLLFSLHCEFETKFAIPDYSKPDTNWKIVESKHYFLNYRPNSLAERDIEKLAKSQDEDFEKILACLQVNYDSKIIYYIYNSKDDKIKSTGSSHNAEAYVEIETVDGIYSENLKSLGAHESVHVIAYWKIGLPFLTLLSEGLAVMVDGSWWGEPLHRWTKQFIEEGKLVPIVKLISNFRYYDDKITYPEAGSFVLYLIDKYGIGKFKYIYTRANESNFSIKFKEVYGQSLSDFEEEWKTYVFKNNGLN